MTTVSPAAGAIAEAKGTECTDNFGNLKKVVLRRGSTSREVNVRRIQKGEDPDVPLEPGDKVYVPAKRLGF